MAVMGTYRDRPREAGSGALRSLLLQRLKAFCAKWYKNQGKRRLIRARYQAGGQRAQAALVERSA